jgi:hypothetical protein
MKKTSPGKVFVEKPDVLNDIIDSVDTKARTNAFHRTINVNELQNATNTLQNNLLKEEKLKMELQTESIMKQNIKKSLEREKAKQEKMFPVLLENVEKAQRFLDTIDKDIFLHDETEQNKTRRQFEDWNFNVHGSIQVLMEVFLFS